MDALYAPEALHQAYVDLDRAVGRDASSSGDPTECHAYTHAALRNIHPFQSQSADSRAAPVRARISCKVASADE
jgi:hypothetical protein